MHTLTDRGETRGKLAVPAWFAVTAMLAQAAFPVQVSIDTNTTYQTVFGYGCATYLAPQLTGQLRSEIISELVNGLGLNRLRLELPGGNALSEKRWEWFNDDANPEHIDWPAFRLVQFDDKVQNFFLQ
jgi:hypothetical protein